MPAQFEHRPFAKGSRLWICCYRQLNNAPHWHLEPEIIALEAGSATVEMHGAAYEMKPGDVVVCSQDTVHRIAAQEPSRLIVLQYDRQLFKPLFLRQPLFRDTYGVIRHLRDVHREALSAEPFHDEKAAAILRCVLIDILRHEEQLPETEAISRTMQRFEKCITFLEENPNEANFADAVRFMNMSEGYFSRYFKQMVGMTFSRYVNVMRIDRALEVMAASPTLTMSEVMRRCGFYSLRNFNRVFKDVTGYAPTRLPADYRLQRRTMVTASPLFDPTLDSHTLSPDEAYDAPPPSMPA